jgi:hypothetical protein
MVFRDDGNRFRAGHSQETSAIGRHLALNLLRRDPARGSIAQKRVRAAPDDRYLTAILAHTDD